MPIPINTTTDLTPGTRVRVRPAAECGPSDGHMAGVTGTFLRYTNTNGYAEVKLDVPVAHAPLYSRDYGLLFHPESLEVIS